jgi:UDP-GlcNAc:undecaprenyl-phosphate GlcNAc-1-phosphate transferase
VFNHLQSYKIYIHKDIKDLLNILIFAAVLFGIGYLDDLKKLKANNKFFLFIIIIYIFLFFNDSFVIKQLNLSFYKNSIYLNNFSLIFTILSFLLYLNALNMFDGINLLVPLYTIVIFFIFFFKKIFPDISMIIIISLIFVSYLNYKNLIFLGNNGSLFLATLISCFFINSYNKNSIFFADEIFLLMMIPGIDLIRLFIVRLMNKRHPFSGDRNHLHHLLVNNFGFINSLLLLLILIFIPNMISLIYGYSLLMIILTFFIYFIILFYLSKQKKYLKNKI